MSNGSAPAEGSQGAPNYKTPPLADDLKPQAEEYANSRKSAQSRSKVHVDVTILGEPAAGAEMILIVAGARPGVDGAYRTKRVVHRMNKSGFETRITAEGLA